MTAEPRNATITYPGGLRARWRWARQRPGSGRLRAVRGRRDASSTSAERVAADPEPLCRAELRLEGPRGAWTARFASTISDEPRAIHWDTAGLLVVRYGFHTFGLATATGEPAWEHRSATPIVALLGSSRLAHVVVQAELETFAIEPDGTVAWRVAHSDVVTAAELVGGRLVLTGYDGQLNALDPSTGRLRLADLDGRCEVRPSRLAQRTHAGARSLEASGASRAAPGECGRTVDNRGVLARSGGQCPLRRCDAAPYR